MGQPDSSDASGAITERVDVIIAAWTAQDTIARAVQSALDQKCVRCVIVVDDASPDATAAAARACDRGDGRLLVLTQASNRGPAAARNLALSVSGAEWVAILDADDWMLPDRIGKLLDEASGVDLIGDDLLVVDEGAEHELPRPMLDGIEIEGFIGLADFVLGNVAHHRGKRAELGFIKPLIRRAFLDRHAIRYDDALRLGEDYDLYARALAHHARLRIVPPQGYLYVQRPSSLSGMHSADDLLRLREADTRIMALPGVDRSARRALRAHYQSVDCRLQWRLVIDAFKAGDVRQLGAAFLRSPRVSAYLSAKLWEQLRVRTGRRLRGRGLAAGTA